MGNYILFGAGRDGITTMNYLGADSVLCFCDSFKSGGSLFGIPIIGIDELKEKSELGSVVVSASKLDCVVEMSKTLDSLGIPFVYWQDLVGDLIRNEGRKFNELSNDGSFVYDRQDEYIVINDRYGEAGTISSYFWQDLWAAKHICARGPKMHYDIGSRVDGFIAHLLSFGQQVTQIDIRPLDYIVPGLEFINADATNLDGVEDGSIESLSALCSLEHFGLGRYGDDIDPDACFKCFRAIKRKIKTKGTLYISVPIGKEHLEFNAHRVFFASTIVKEFEGMQLEEFSSCYKGQIEYNVNIHQYDDWSEHGGERFGLFVFSKPE